MAGRGKRSAAGNRRFVAERHKRQEILLRDVGGKQARLQMAAHMMRQNRSLAHSEDAGLGAGMFDDGGAIASREDVFIGERLQRRAKG